MNCILIYNIYKTNTSIVLKNNTKAISDKIKMILFYLILVFVNAIFNIQC